MFRDFAIVSTAFGADLREIKKCGVVGVVSLLMGVLSSFVVGAVMAYFMGYPDVVSMVTVGAGVCTFVVGPVTGAVSWCFFRCNCDFYRSRRCKIRTRYDCYSVC